MGKNCKPIALVDYDTGEVIEVYQDISMAADDNFLNEATIRTAIRERCGKIPLRQIAFRYINDEEKSMNKVVRMAVEKMGKEIEQVVVMEELAELQKEISKMIRGKGNRIRLIEEMADVAVGFETLKYIHGISDKDLERYVERKASRLHERLQDGTA